jgi:2-polyprenyl-3-methyl-5-hydroxy-6-metoxy-1,4-benzoquinol methylase
MPVGTGMQTWLLPLLVCPKTKQPLSLVDAVDSGEIISGTLVSPNGTRYAIVRGIPRFVKTHYATAFGLQWNRHAKTQIDDDRHRHSRERFWGETGLTPSEIQGRLVLDGGCGAGRFTEVAASAGARVVAIDLSDAVEACYANNRGRSVCVVQASLFDLPFRPETFDFAFTIGVIQHTPDPLRALRGVADSVKVGGAAGISWYKRYWYTYLHQKYWLRPILSRLDEQKLYRFVRWYVPKLLPLSRALARVLPGRAMVDRILPVANRDFVEGLTEAEKIEWAILDTYDWYQPRYDKPQSWRAVEGVMKELGYVCKRAPMERDGLHCVRLQRPQNSTAARRKNGRLHKP